MTKQFSSRFLPMVFHLQVVSHGSDLGSHLLHVKFPYEMR